MIRTIHLATYIAYSTIGQSCNLVVLPIQKWTTTIWNCSLCFWIMWLKLSVFVFVAVSRDHYMSTVKLKLQKKINCTGRVSLSVVESGLISIPWIGFESVVCLRDRKCTITCRRLTLLIVRIEGKLFPSASSKLALRWISRNVHYEKVGHRSRYCRDKQSHHYKRPCRRASESQKPSANYATECGLLLLGGN